MAEARYVLVAVEDYDRELKELSAADVAAMPGLADLVRDLPVGGTVPLPSYIIPVPGVPEANGIKRIANVTAGSPWLRR